MNLFNNSSKREDRLQPFFFLLFPSTFSHFLLSAKEEKEKVDKENQPQMILKRILSRARERCRNYIATERVFCLATEVEPHRYQHSLFLWQLKAQRKSLAKRNAERGKVSPSADGEEASSASTRKLLKKLDQNFTYCKNVG